VGEFEVAMGVDKTGHQDARVYFEARGVMLCSGFKGQDFSRIVCNDDGIFEGGGRNGANPVGGYFAHFKSLLILAVVKSRCKSLILKPLFGV
jgi:hypothetical protein